MTPTTPDQALLLRTGRELDPAFDTLTGPSLSLSGEGVSGGVNS